MNKRGQIFIFAAIIVALVTFVLFTKPNTMQEEILLENFGGISQNYLSEAPKVVDHSIYYEDLVEEKLGDYTTEFLKYARNQLDPNVGVIYVYINASNILIDNQLNKETVTIKKVSGIEPVDVSILSRNTDIEGDLILEEVVAVGTKTTLCENIKNYCIIKAGKGEEPIILKVGEYLYEFDVTTENPSIIVIVKSFAKDTTKVDISETII